MERSEYADLLECEIECEEISEDCVIDWLAENNYLDALILEYKIQAPRWKRSETVFRSYPSLKKLQDGQRSIAYKHLVMSGFEDEDSDGSMGWCAYCGIHLNICEMEVEHVQSQIEGGSSQWDNLVPACPDCNGEKAGQSADDFVNNSGLTLLDKCILLGRWQAARQHRETHPLIDFHFGALSKQKRASLFGKTAQQDAISA
jgi:hypothetical protein